jgi:hypothetical protein
MTICAPDGRGTVCDALPAQPGEERCDGLDNDCDGIVDNGFDLGARCTVGEAACQVVGERICGPDGDAVCSAELGPVGEEVCNGLDDDCDGEIDEDLGLGQRCTNGLGQCQAEGVRVCGLELEIICDAIPGVPGAEICDELDNDCDGLVDNDCDPMAGIALPPNEGFGEHGSCGQWNDCVDAEGCANAACEHEGHGPAISWEEAMCGPDYVCRIFSGLGNAPQPWQPRGDCNLPIATNVVCVGAGMVREVCDDGFDNSGNGLVDCDDPQCVRAPECAREICDDGFDNTGNDLVDCDDPQCARTPECGQMGGQIGQFNVSDGPPWREAEAMSCVSACAQIFGGVRADYGCSTVDGAYNGRAHLDGYGDGQYCVGDAAEDFVTPGEGQVYNCGAEGCSYSAYVDDHSADCGNAVNYCWRMVDP